MRIRKCFITTFLAASLASAGFADSSDEGAIRKMVADFAIAFNQRNAQTLSLFWVQDGEFVDPIGRIASGRTEIAGLLEEYLFAIPQNINVSFSVTGIRFVRPDVAIVNTKRIVAAKGRAEVLAHLIQVLKKRGEAWSIVSATFAGDMPVTSVAEPPLRNLPKANFNEKE